MLIGSAIAISSAIIVSDGSVKTNSRNAGSKFGHLKFYAKPQQTCRRALKLRLLALPSPTSTSGASPNVDLLPSGKMHHYRAPTNGLTVGHCTQTPTRQAQRNYVAKMALVLARCSVKVKVCSASVSSNTIDFGASFTFLPANCNANSLPSAFNKPSANGIWNGNLLS